MSTPGNDTADSARNLPGPSGPATSPLLAPESRNPFLRWDESVRGLWVMLALLIAGGWFLTAPLIDTYHTYTFEADADPTIKHVMAFRQYFAGFDFSVLPSLANYPPYYDGQFIIYTAFSYLVQALRSVGLAGVALSTEQSLVIFSVRYCNAILHCLAAVPLLFAVRRITGSNLLSLGAGLLMLLSPQVLDIDLIRVDHVVFAALSLLLYLSLRIVSTPAPSAMVTWAALVAGFLVTTKLSCAAFLIFPGLSVGWLLWQRRLSVKALWLPAVVFCATALLLSFRYLAHGPGEAISSAVAKLRHLDEWKDIMALTPRFYYNWDLFLPDGRIFIYGCLGSVAANAILAIRAKAVDRFLVLAYLLAFSAAGGVAFKYTRGGYHLVPLYLLSLFMLFGSVRMAVRSDIRWFVTLALLALLCFPIRAEVLHYQQLKSVLNQRTESTQLIRIQPREWLVAHAKPGARIATPIHSDWANPPIYDLGFDFQPPAFQFPYLDRNKSTAFLPPDFKALEAQCDFVLLNNFHKQVYLDTMAGFGLTETAAKWTAFLQQLGEHYPVVSFHSETPNYGISRIEIYIINPEAFRASP